MNDAPSNDFCDIVVSEKVAAGSRYEVQFQFSEFTLTLAVKDPSFAERILGFIAETKGNPVYRDVCLGGGTFQPMPEKTVDLSASFLEPSVVIEKDGEYDDSYVIRVAGPMGSVRFDLRGKRWKLLLKPCATSFEAIRKTAFTGIGEAKQLVMSHPAWADEAAKADLLHTEVERAMNPDAFADRWRRKEHDCGFEEIAANLIMCGPDALPDSAAPCVTFEQAASPIAIWEAFGTPADWSPGDRERLAPYRMIGSDGAGNPICVEQGTGAVVLLGHDDRFRSRQFVNSSVRQLAECLLAYMGERDPESFRRPSARSTRRRL